MEMHFTGLSVGLAAKFWCLHLLSFVPVSAKSLCLSGKDDVVCGKIAQ